MKQKQSLKDQILEEKEKIKQSIVKEKGICYMSRVPPYMKVSTIKELLSAYNVERVYLTPEEDQKQKFRVKQGGNKSRKYTEGWIEFADKKVAKMVAMSLNNTKMVRKKKSFYYEDVWSLQYLPKFKWNNLTEKLAYDLRIRKERLNAQLKKSTKKKEFYLDQIQKSKKIMGIINKKRKQDEIQDDQNQDDGLKKKKKTKLDTKFTRVFSQKSVVEDDF